ncbi:MAG: type II toxin-antitoxin system VapC family toxin [Thermaerobacter sp.]|nr:type II toxin-antitoxin system VapC family toxin [Thermaerobacter sp.]
MRLIDTCVFIYAAGRNHPMQDACRRVYRSVLADPSGYTIDTEVLREILHLYRSRDELRRGTEMVWNLLQLFPSPIPISRMEIEVAVDLLRSFPQLCARDAIHAAVVQTHRLHGIVSVDHDFDAVDTLQRLDPEQL